MRFLTLDWYYPEAFDAAKRHPEGIFHFSHGTSDYLDIALRAAGHEAETVVVNAEPHWQIKVAEFKPTHIISQNVGIWGAYEGSPLSEHRRFHGCKLIGFCSYAAVDQTLTGWDALFSSFNWMPEYCEKLGQKCHYLPLAFGRPVLDRIGELPKERDIPVAFFGGLGYKIWNQGTATMAAIADAVPGFQWHGYAVGDLPMSLQMIHQPAKYGLDYYRLLARTKICLNRHGEISKKSGNNMRQYEAGGMGCCLLTDELGEFGGIAMVYEDADDAIYQMKNCMYAGAEEDEGRFMQETVLEHCCYENRAVRFLEIVESL